MFLYVLFFFSSRRRHTRLQGDWSSDVCSSDLVPGWKKAVVSFAGPLPGIVLGGAIGFAGASMGQPLLLKIGVTSVVLNGFNLLPVLPLDGGWFLHAILLSLYYLIEMLFLLCTIVSLIVNNTRI